jgi:hypothetical protein
MLARAMTRCSLVFILALSSACGSGGAPPSDAGKAGPAPAAKPADELKDRSQAAPVPTKETMAGVGFSVDVPAGLKREANDKDKWINWTFTDGNPFKDPSITVTVSDPVMVPQDLDALVRSATMMSQDKPPLVVSKQEQLPGGGILVIAERADGQYFKLEAIHRSGDKVVRCSVSQRTGTGRPNDAAIPNFAGTKTWAEKICGSLKID